MDLTGQAFVLDAGIVFREEEEGAFLYNPETDALRCVNKVGAAICRQCNGAKDIDAICRELKDEFDIALDDDRLRDQVAGFVQEMIALNLIHTR